MAQPTLQDWNDRLAPMFPGLMGVTLTAVSADGVSARMTVLSTLQWFGHSEQLTGALAAAAFL